MHEHVHEGQRRRICASQNDRSTPRFAASIGLLAVCRALRRRTGRLREVMAERQAVLAPGGDKRVTADGVEASSGKALEIPVVLDARLLVVLHVLLLPSIGC